IRGAGRRPPPILVAAGLLGEGAGAILGDPGKHAIPHAEPFDLAADGNGFPRKVIAEHERKLWPPDGAKLSLPELESHRVQPRSVHLDENIAPPRHRGRDIHQRRPFRAAVMLENVGAHASPYITAQPAIPIPPRREQT